MSNPNIPSNPPAGPNPPVGGPASSPNVPDGRGQLTAADAAARDAAARNAAAAARDSNYRDPRDPAAAARGDVSARPGARGPAAYGQDGRLLVDQYPSQDVTVFGAAANVPITVVGMSRSSTLVRVLGRPTPASQKPRPPHSPASDADGPADPSDFTMQSRTEGANLIVSTDTSNFTLVVTFAG